MMEDNIMKMLKEMVEKEVERRLAPQNKKYHAMCSRNGGLTAKNNRLKRELEEKDSKIAELEKQVDEADSMIYSIKNQLEKVKGNQAEIDRLHNHIKQVKEQRDFMYSEYEKEIANLKEQSKNSAKELNKDVAYYYYPTEASDISFATKKLMLDCKKLGIKNIDGKNFMDREIRTFLEYSDRFELFSKEDAIKIINNLGVR